MDCNKIDSLDNMKYLILFFLAVSNLSMAQEPEVYGVSVGELKSCYLSVYADNTYELVLDYYPSDLLFSILFSYGAWHL
ncbi:MAG: hypothetical protein K9I94_02500, partial [Bacteroidales bacterium]|nr:hypothetical protein [Bacteroidales bacterium]